MLNLYHESDICGAEINHIDFYYKLESIKCNLYAIGAVIGCSFLTLPLMFLVTGIVELFKLNIALGAFSTAFIFLPATLITFVFLMDKFEEIFKNCDSQLEDLKFKKAYALSINS